ncbi:MAG: protease pro-enzyme activation domain-containing protein [Fimbriimonas sp.]|nr:protease pro-enzyme activation domain-containing protein [Fimbriimonas sp.]
MRKVFLAGALVFAVGFGTTALGQTVKLTQLSQPVPSIIQKSQLVSHKALTDIVHVNISLTPPNPGALQAFADSVSNPNSPNFHKFATPDQLGQLFGQPASTVQKIVSYLQGKGFKVTLIAKSRLNVMADATVAQVESAFNTTINNYHSLSPSDYRRTDYYSYSEPIEFPVATAAVVVDVTGLDNIAKPHPRWKKVAAAKAKKFNKDPLTPTQTRTLYNTAPMYKAGMQGQGRNVAISSFDGFKLSNVPLYYTQFNLPVPSGGVGSNVKVVTVDGGSGSGTPGGEADLDIQMVLGMAPLCSFTVYDGGGGILDVLTKEENDNTADIISESYGWMLTSSQALACHNLHVLMTSEGITYMEATGDYGTTLEPYSYSNYEPECFQVGGTVANTDSAGNRTTEVGWSGSGGGWATESVSFNTLPSWQKGLGVPTTINYRLNPDVALNAAGATTGAYQFYFNGTLNFDYDGTSFASPVFAGALAVTEQKVISLGGNNRLGRIADMVYNQNGRSDVWFDVTSGSNGTLPNGTASNAGPFWDFVTGWGAVNFAALAQSVAVTKPSVYNISTINVYVNKALNPNVTEGQSWSKINVVPFRATSVLESAIGRVVTTQGAFNTTVNASKVASISLVASGSAPAAATVTVYILNQKTAKYETLKSLSGTAFGTPATLVVQGTPLTNYFAPNGQIQVLVRSLVPNSRSTQVPSDYVFMVNQLQVSIVQNLN